jgi:hypothetical protein
MYKNPKKNLHAKWDTHELLLLCPGHANKVISISFIKFLVLALVWIGALSC